MKPLTNWLSWGLLVALCLLLPGELTAADRDSGMAQLVGVWQLDQRASEDPRSMMRRSGGAPPPSGGDGPAPEMPPRAVMVMDGINVLTIGYQDGVVTLTDWSDDVQTLKVGGKKQAVDRKGFSVQQEAGWKGSDRLVVKTTGLSGGWLRETYELGQRGAKLFVLIEVQIKGSRYPVSFQRVYNRSSAE